MASSKLSDQSVVVVLLLFLDADGSDNGNDDKDGSCDDPRSQGFGDHGVGNNGCNCVWDLHLELAICGLNISVALAKLPP